MGEKNGLLKLMLVLLVLVLISTFILGYLLFTGNNKRSSNSILGGKKEQTIDLDDFVVNLKPEGSRKAYLKIKVAVMYDNPKKTKLVENNISKMRDIITNEFRSKTVEEIQDVAKVDSLKNGIIENINKSIGEDVIKEIYLTDIVIQ